MIESNNQLDSLISSFKEFQALHVIKNSEDRKKLVRKLQAQVKSGKATISSDQVSEFLTSDFELARILVYLAIEFGKVNSDQEMWREIILNEWELLTRSKFDHEVSRMSLYYAFRAYAARLKAMPELVPAEKVERDFIGEVVDELSKSVIDRKSQVLKRATELLAIIKNDDAAFSPDELVDNLSKSVTKSNSQVLKRETEALSSIESSDESSPPEWSERKKWVMGILAAVIAAGLIGVFNWVGTEIVTKSDQTNKAFHPDCDKYGITINQKFKKVEDLEELVLVSGNVQSLPTNLHLWVATTLPAGSREFYPRDEVFPDNGKWEIPLNPKLKHAKDVKRFSVFVVGDQGHKIIDSHISSMKKANPMNWQPLNQDVFDKGEIVRCHGIYKVAVK